MCEAPASHATLLAMVQNHIRNTALMQYALYSCTEQELHVTQESIVLSNQSALCGFASWREILRGIKLLNMLNLTPFRGFGKVLT